MTAPDVPCPACNKPIPADAARCWRCAAPVKHFVTRRLPTVRRAPGCVRGHRLDATGKPVDYCGKPAVPGSIYCADHQED